MKTSADDELSLRLGDGLRVPPRAVRRVVSELAERSDRWLSDRDQLPFDRAQVSKLRRVIEHRRSTLRSG